MSNMFSGATAFNQNIGEWNVSQVTDMSNMFDGATTFNQNIGGWPITNNCNDDRMFRNSGVSAETFTGIYGNKISIYFNLQNPNEDMVWERFTRWDRRKNAVRFFDFISKNDPQFADSKNDPQFADSKNDPQFTEEDRPRAFVKIEYNVYKKIVMYL